MDFFASFLDAVPGWLRLLLAISLTVGITLTFVSVFHGRILEMQDDPDEKDDEAADDTDGETRVSSETEQRSSKAPPAFYLGGRAISLVSVAFIFIFAFCVNNFWTNNQDARAAVENELSDMTRISTLAQSMNSPIGTQVLDSIATYRRSIIETEWPLMSDADSTAASQAHEKAAMVVATTILKAESQGAKNYPQWSAITRAVDDMIAQGKERTNYLPAPASPGIIGLIFILGITNLALTAAYQPARLRQHLFLTGVMAGITALMFFLVVETSNPYVGGGGISPSIYGS